MKYCLVLVMINVVFGCTGNDIETKSANTESMRNRNLALAYIDSGMMKEASEKLAELEKSLPNEPFVYANQGLVALRQNNLDESSRLLEKANALSPNVPEIALLRGEVAMLTGQFEKANSILENAIQMRVDSRKKESFAGKITSAMRNQFGGHKFNKANKL